MKILFITLVIAISMFSTCVCGVLFENVEIVYGTPCIVTNEKLSKHDRIEWESSANVVNGNIVTDESFDISLINEAISEKR